MKRRQKINYKEQGITLIALVVTIIVLLILTGVTISLALGQNGIIQKAKDASVIYANASMNAETMLEEFSNEVIRLGESDSNTNNDIKSVCENFILMDNGKLYEINDLVDTEGMNFPFNNENLDLSLYAENVKELFRCKYILTYDNKLYDTNHYIVPQFITENIKKITYFDYSNIYLVDNNDTYYVCSDQRQFNKNLR